MAAQQEAQRQHDNSLQQLRNCPHPFSEHQSVCRPVAMCVGVCRCVSVCGCVCRCMSKLCSPLLSSFPRSHLSQFSNNLSFFLPPLKIMIVIDPVHVRAHRERARHIHTHTHSEAHTQCKREKTCRNQDVSFTQMLILRLCWHPPPAPPLLLYFLPVVFSLHLSPCPFH